MDTPQPILSFEDVTIESDPLYETGIWDIRFVLQPGDLLLVRVETLHERLPLADAAVGLAIPSQGRVLFLGENWPSMSADKAAAQRGRTGRVFDGGGWVRNLNVDENIMLLQRHHTERPDHEILDEAMGLARLFGLPGLPCGRPERMSRLDLQKAACVRAFLGHPKLILLERPTHGVYADLIASLVNAVQAARNRGAAVLWTTDDAKVWNDRGLRTTMRAKMFGSQLHLMDR